MITEDYVSFEVAKLLKEKGFDEKCPRWYVANEPQEGIVERGFGENQFYINAPTQQMAMRWLRERPKIAYNIFVFSDGGLGELHYRYEIQEIDNELLQCNGSLDTEDKNYDSYEQAVEAALKYTLENLI